MNGRLTNLLLLAVVIPMSNASFAKTLPKDAAAIAPSSLKAFYSGSTAKWSHSMAYFGPDGTVKGVYTAKDGGKHAYVGTWDVKRNEVCMHVSGVGKSGTTTDCWKWYYGSDKTYWTLWSVHYDKTKPKKTDYYTHEIDNFVRGDAVSKEFARLAG